jgi:hypothetical protein
MSVVMSVRRCVCGKPIRLRDPLCKSCRELYGSKAREWPDWVKFLVSDEQREIDRMRMHDYDRQLDDEVSLPISDVAEHNLARARSFPEMSFDEFAILNQ